MFIFSKSHPFAVEAFFEQSLVLTFAIPKEELESMLPECLELDSFQDKWAFIAVAMVQTSGLRPKGFPKIIGNDFFLIGYRVFVKYHSPTGKRLRGLYIIKSETDKKKMEWLGNIFTKYNYTTTDILYRTENELTEITSKKSNFKVQVNLNNQNAGLPGHSPFSEWKEARRFAGPLPFTFTYDSVKKEVLIIEGVRSNWIPKPVEVLQYQFGFLEQLNLTDLRLANAFVLKDIPYSWKKGRKETWNN